MPLRPFAVKSPGRGRAACGVFRWPGRESQDAQIEICNVSNGERFSTYIIKARRGSGEISLNGAAARKVQIGDLLIICAYSMYSDAEVADHPPVILLLDGKNRLL